VPTLLGYGPGPMGKILSVAVVLAMTACGGEEVPSCQVALTNFYDVGCVFTENNAVIPVAEMIQRCKDALGAAPASCEDEMDDYQICLGSVANDTQCVDCTDEADALLTCD
jgi:hypothetical protein